MLMSYDGGFMSPGEMPPLEIVFDELTSVIWGRLELQVINGIAPIVGTARDAGNTPTDVLRSGLLLTKTAAGKYTDWGSVVNTATDKIEGILLTTLKMQRVGVNQDRHLGYILVGGLVKANGIIIPGNSTSGIVGDALETAIRQQLHPAFRFDDDPIGHLAV